MADKALARSNADADGREALPESLYLGWLVVVIGLSIAVLSWLLVVTDRLLLVSSSSFHLSQLLTAYYGLLILVLVISREINDFDDFLLLFDLLFSLPSPLYNATRANEACSSSTGPTSESSQNYYASGGLAYPECSSSAKEDIDLIEECGPGADVCLSCLDEEFGL
jgi:hypothetical protein